MAHLEAATKAPLAVVLPSLLSFSFVEQNGSLPSNWLPVAKNYHQAAKLDDNSSVRITPPEGESKALSDGNIIENLLSISQIPPRTDSIDEWVRFSYSLATKNAPELQKSLLKLESSLTLRTYLASRHTVTLADIAVWATIRGNHVASSLAKKLYVNVARWYNFIEASSPWISQTIADFTAAESADRAKAKAAASAAGASFEIIDMPDVEGPMVTRFPPEPSGYLHIGHAKAALLNEYFARKKAGGVLICRWDDTNPSNESMDFQDAIKEDLALMEIIPDKLSYSSDYFQQMHDLAIQLIKDGKAFADDSALGKGDESRKNRLPSPRRDMSIEETLQRFEEMRTGSTEGQRWCLRARIAYDSPNGTLRDPVIYRCNLTPHHRTGTEWKIYPTYDFCAPILDSIEGVTLALRTNEYRDRNVQYEWMQKNLNLRAVPIWDFSRLNFIRTVLSKRKLTRIVADGKVWGWDDPRMPTIRGIVRRGMTVPALREFILAQGPSRNVVNLEWGTFWATNKKHVDPVAPRYTAVESKDAVTCDVTLPDGSAPASTELSVPKYVKNLSLGNRSVQTAKSVIIEQVDAQTLKEGEMVTLMNWGNAIVQSITRDDTTVKGVALQFQPESRDFKNTKKFTWLAAVEDNMIPAQLMDFDHLITKDKLEPTDVLEECLNPVTQTVTEAFTDRDTKALAKGAIVQLERKAYYRLDTPYSDAKTPMVFFRIPAK